MLKAFCIWLGLCTTISGPARPIDGDTISVSGHSIRLQGIDAEELDEPHGSVAKRAMARLVEGHDVVCRLSGDRSYHRYVATCYIDDKDIAQSMIEQGLALDCARYSHGKYRQFEPANIRQRLLQKPYC